MKRFLRWLFSMEVMLGLTLVFALSIAVATFIENDFGTDAARKAVYWAVWFEILILVLGVNLVGNAVTRRLWAKGGSWAFLFHFSFVVIGLGYGLTRYAGYESVMHIREGESSNRILTDRAFLFVRVQEGSRETVFEKPLLLSPIGRNAFSEKITAGTDEILIRYHAFLPEAERKAVEAPGGIPMVSLSVFGKGQTRAIVVPDSETVVFSDIMFGFDAAGTDSMPGVRFFYDEAGLRLSSNRDIAVMSMEKKSEGIIPANTIRPMEARTVYTTEGVRFALDRFFPSARMEAVLLSRASLEATSDETPPAALVVDVASGNLLDRVSLFGGGGVEGEIQTIRLNGMELSLSYGAKTVFLPFSLRLVDFKIGRYPGSRRPSSFASDVVLLDAEKKIDKPVRIFMNHILKHRGFRFYQSAYDDDEMGTILSVSRDPGTPVTYVGYFLLALGLLINLFHPSGRFRRLGKVPAANASRTVISGMLLPLAVVLSASSLRAQVPFDKALNDVRSIDRGHSRRFASLLVLDRGGRIKPAHTVAEEIIKRAAGSEKPLGLSTGQIALGFWIRPGAWRSIPLIPVLQEAVRKELGLDAGSRKAAVNDFYDPATGVYKLDAWVRAAREKTVSQQTGADREILRIDDGLVFLDGVFRGEEFRIFPMRDDPMRRWISAQAAGKMLLSDDAETVSHLVTAYTEAVDSALADGNWSRADRTLEAIRKFQHSTSTIPVPAAWQVRAEIAYNEIRIFERLCWLYWIAGGLFLIYILIDFLGHGLRTNLITRILWAVLFAGFLLHTSGLVLRWIASGHAPWSNKYESMVYIAWATALAGLVFSRRSLAPAAMGAVFSGLILYVAHLDWMDPRIGLLAPVLRSHWLVIHVSIITASYGFLGVGACLAFWNLVLFILKTKKREDRIGKRILELTRIIERILLVGLVLVTLGNMFGAVWANESWGRYWGWDPKETWTLVIILFYAIVIHSRTSRAFSGPFFFNVLSVLAFGSVLMTYFGVNFYLSGFHSYAQGDPLPIPRFVYVTAAVLVLAIGLGFGRRKITDGDRESAMPTI